VINFENPGLQLVIEHDIEAKYFEAHGVVHVVRLTRTVSVPQLRLYRTNCLYYVCLYVFHYLVSIVSHLSEVLHGESKTPFVPDVIFTTAFV